MDISLGSMGIDIDELGLQLELELELDETLGDPTN